MIQVQEQNWTTNTDFTLENYQHVLGGKTYEVRTPDGTTETVQGDNLSERVPQQPDRDDSRDADPDPDRGVCGLRLRLDALPGTADRSFIMVVALLVVPLQIALVPILTRLRHARAERHIPGHLAGAYWLRPAARRPICCSTTSRSCPAISWKSAFIDGASHFTIFRVLILPLSVPALASFAIFQFLWVWNDYLVALIFIGAKPDVQVLTMRLADMVGSRGNDWHLLTAGAFVSMILPLVVFFGLQRFFVRGLLAGSVKG